MRDHLTPEDFFEFIDQGGSSGPVGHHLMGCPECSAELDFLLLAGAPATPEEEAVLSGLPEWTPEELLERLLQKVESSRPSDRDRTKDARATPIFCYGTS